MNPTISDQELKELREFKSEVIELYWEKFGTFYLHIMPHPDLEIGRRGLVGEEKELGIILVLGPKAVKDYFLDEKNLYCELQFGFTWEKLTLPWDCLFRVYDKAQNAVTQMRFFTAPVPTAEDPGNTAEHSNIIQVDFGGKRKK